MVEKPFTFLIMLVN